LAARRNGRRPDREKSLRPIVRPSAALVARPVKRAAAPLMSCLTSIGGITMSVWIASLLLAGGVAPPAGAIVSLTPSDRPERAAVAETAAALATPPDFITLPHTVSAATVVRRGPFVSVQVNVDDNGANIPGDAAHGPSMAIDPTEPARMAIGFRYYDTLETDLHDAGFAYTQDGGRAWSFPGVLAPVGSRYCSVLDADREGGFYYHTQRCPWDECADLFRSTDGGRTWSGPFAATDGEKGWLGVDRSTGIGRGHIYIASGGAFGRSLDGGQSFQPPVPVDGYFGTLRVATDGTVYVVGRSTLAKGAPVSRSDDARDPRVVPSFNALTPAPLGGDTLNGGPNRIGLLGQPWIDMDESDGPYAGSLYVLQSVKPQGVDPLEVHLARSVDGGQSWTGPIRVSDDPPDSLAWQWFGTLSVAPQSGRVDVVWNDTRNTTSDDESELYYAYSTDGGRTFSRNMPLGPVFDSTAGWPEWGIQRKLGHYYHMRSDEKGGRLAYAATYNGEQDVYYLHTVLDCNDNGLHDGDDVALGRSPDVNKNGVPDECPCDPLKSLHVDCDRGHLTAYVQSSFAEGTELTLFDNGRPVPIVIDGSGSGKVTWEIPAPGYHMMDLDGCPLWGQTVYCELRCRTIDWLKLRCGSRRLRAIVKTQLPEGSILHLVRGRDSYAYSVDARGRIRAAWRVGVPQEYTVGIEECRQFEERILCQ